VTKQVEVYCEQKKEIKARAYIFERRLKFKPIAASEKGEIRGTS
jgi:hypothetical protein